MEFGEILEEWERIKRSRAEERKSSPPPDSATASRGSSPAARALESWLDAKGVHDKDSEEAERGPSAESHRAEARRLDSLKPQESIDLHGMSAEAARLALAAFLESCARRGLEKVLVVHGKGIHSGGKPVLKAVARGVVESSPWAGRIGVANKDEGGGGAMWVILRSRR
ncbi:MAG: Smr/MutS family protein [Spirochaetaceae bacterium]|nr:Smr/MutS family protein [Spirochaetaceae bacterium]